MNRRSPPRHDQKLRDGWDDIRPGKVVHVPQTRPPDLLAQENQELKRKVSSLYGEVRKLKRRNQALIRRLRSTDVAKRPKKMRDKMLAKMRDKMRDSANKMTVLSPSCNFDCVECSMAGLATCERSDTPSE